MGIKQVQCRMLVGSQQRGSTFTEHVDPKDIEACRVLARDLAAERRLPPDRAVLQIKVNGRWESHRAS